MSSEIKIEDETIQNCVAKFLFNLDFEQFDISNISNVQKLSNKLSRMQFFPLNIFALKWLEKNE